MLSSKDESESLFAVPDWLRRQRDLLNSTIAALSRLSHEQPRRPSLLPLLVADTSSAAKNIVDFGGGCGWVFAACQHARARIEHYTIIELSSVVSEFSPVNEGPLRYCDVSTFLQSPQLRTDILYSNSCLQYQSDNSLLMSVISQCRPSQVLVDELLWSRGEDWFSIQTNSEVKTVSRFVSVSNLARELAMIGYSLIWRNSSSGTEFHGFPSMSEFDQSYRIQSRLSLLFSISKGS